MLSVDAGHELLVNGCDGAWLACFAAETAVRLVDEQDQVPVGGNGVLEDVPEQASAVLLVWCNQAIAGAQHLLIEEIDSPRFQLRVVGAKIRADGFQILIAERRQFVGRFLEPRFRLLVERGRIRQPQDHCFGVRLAVENIAAVEQRLDDGRGHDGFA